MMDDASIASIGHNQPPEPTPFEQSRDEIEGLFNEATNWLDGSPVQTQAQADEISKLVALLRAAEKTADERRKAENKPFDDGKAEVQARYNPLIQDKRGRTYLAIEACKKALAPFLKKQDDEKRAIAEAAQKEAAEKRRIAEEAIRAANKAEPNLAASSDAEWLLDQAKQADEIAKNAAKDKAAARGGARAMTLRTVYRHEMTSYNEFARYVWATHLPDIQAFLDDYAARLVRVGVRNVPGVKVIEEHVAQ